MSGRLAGPASQAGGRGKETERRGASSDRTLALRLLAGKQEGGIDGEGDCAPARTRGVAIGDRMALDCSSQAEAEHGGRRR